MNVDFLIIGIFIAAAVIFALLIPLKWRGWYLFCASIAGIYWLQSFTPLRFGDFILQTVTLLLTVLTWWVTRPMAEKDSPKKPALTREDWTALILLFGLIILVSFNRFLDPAWRFTPSRPPSPLLVAMGLIGSATLFALCWRWLRRVNQHRLLTAVILLVVVLFVILKLPPLTTGAAALWRRTSGQQVTLAAPSDLIWLGYSYVAFRLIQALRDRQTGALPRLNLREFVTYVLFFPSYIAGPIDRVERFSADFRRLPELPRLEAARWFNGGSRILIGLFKKFVIADTLALGMSLTTANAEQTTSSLWLWLLLYGYALRLFFDFSGYTDIAIGIGILLGIKLPENFNRPYLKTNISAFWQSWHISLSDWVRFYVFSPLSRSLLRRKPRPSLTLILFTAHMTTMIVIGLWHGITINFFIWGCWHGLALFVHKKWSDRSRKWYRSLNDKPWQKRGWTAGSWFLTFNYVSLGWVWFALPTPQLAGQTFARLFGL